MIHQYLAALFCTTGLICWAAEAALQKNQTSSMFAWIYGASMLGWVALGAFLDSSALVIIGTLQFVAAVSINFFINKKV